MKESLFGLGETLAELNRIIDASEDGEIDEALAKFLDDTEEKVEGKVDVYCSLIREREALAEARYSEAERIKGLAETDDSFAQRMRCRLAEFMEKTQRPRIETMAAKLRMQNAGGKLPIEITGDIPITFEKLVPSPDREKIREALERGEQLPFAKLGERGRILVIK